jgi:hypothetical protein
MPRIADRVAPGGSASHAPRLAAGQGAGPHPNRAGPAPHPAGSRREGETEREIDPPAAGTGWSRGRRIASIDRSRARLTGVNPRGKPAGWPGIRSKGDGADAASGDGRDRVIPVGPPSGRDFLRSP